MNNTIRIGTRTSSLALRQTQLVCQALRAAAPELVIQVEARQTKGDKILEKPLQEFGGKGVFVSEFEQGILEGRLDLAVHSAKDMPMELEPGLAIVGVPEREDPRDVLVTAAGWELPKNGKITVGTSSPRRALQIELLGAALWPGVQVVCQNLRGNVQTRLDKLEQGRYDVIILAAAGLKRLQLEADARYRYRYMDCGDFIPAGGQGILAVEGVSGSTAAAACGRISDPGTWRCLLLERRILKLLGAGCHEPIGVYAREREGLMEVSGISKREEQIYRIQLEGTFEQLEEMAAKAAKGLGGR